jgi:hypothetical protein
VVQIHPPQPSNQQLARQCNAQSIGFPQEFPQIHGECQPASPAFTLLRRRQKYAIPVLKIGSILRYPEDFESFITDHLSIPEVA